MKKPVSLPFFDIEKTDYEKAFQSFLINLRQKSFSSPAEAATYFHYARQTISRFEGAYKSSKTIKPELGYVCELLRLYAVKDEELLLGNFKGPLLKELNNVLKYHLAYDKEFHKIRQFKSWDQVGKLAKEFMDSRPAETTPASEGTEDVFTEVYDSETFEGEEEKPAEINSTNTNQQESFEVNHFQEIYNGPYYENYSPTTNYNYPPEVKVVRFDFSQKVLVAGIVFIGMVVILIVAGVIFLRPKDVDAVGRTASNATPTITNLGEVRLVKFISISNPTPFVDELVTVTFTIENVDTHAVYISDVGAGARFIPNPASNCTDNKWNGEAYDFPHVHDLVLQPGQTYTYSQSKDFSYPGPGFYFAAEIFKFNNDWSGFPSLHRNPADGMVCFTVKPRL